MPPKKHQKTLTQEISSQALLQYLQNREQLKSRNSNSPKVDPKVIVTIIEKRLAFQSTPYTSLRNTAAVSPKQQPQRIRSNLKLKTKHLQTESSVSHEYPSSPLLSKMLHLVSPGKTFLSPKAESKPKAPAPKHHRLQSMNDEVDFADKLLASYQSKQRLQESRKNSDVGPTHMKTQSNVQLTDLLKNRMQQGGPGDYMARQYHEETSKTMLLLLVYKQKRYRIETEYTDLKIQRLYDMCNKHIQALDGKDTPEIVSLQSHKASVLVDYVLSKRNLPMTLLTQYPEQPIMIEPIMGLPKELKSTKVGLKDFEFIRCIGSGGFSKVYLVRERSTGQYYAMKLIEKQSLFSSNKHSIIQNERIIMSSTTHPFIVKMQYAFESQTYLVFVLEYCSGGELFYLLRKIKKMPEQQAFFYFTEICLALKCLHDNNIVYRDIKPENILLDIDGHLRIADFGLSKPGMGTEDVAYSFCGSPEYMAPEMLLKQGHNYQLDLYCLGALLYELVTGLPPFYCKNTEEIYHRILNQKLTYPPQLPLSPLIKDLLNQLLAKNPKKRIDSIDAILRHPWMQQWGGGKMYLDILEKRIQPPYCPDLYRFNFDENEFGKGEAEFVANIRVLQGTIQENFPRQLFMKDFYYNQDRRQVDCYMVDTGGTSNPLYLNVGNLASPSDYKQQYSQRSSGKKPVSYLNQRMNTVEDNSEHKKQLSILQQLRMQTDHEQQLKKQLK